MNALMIKHGCDAAFDDVILNILNFPLFFLRGRLDCSLIPENRINKNTLDGKVGIANERLHTKEVQ